MHGQSKSGDHLQSVLFVFELQVEIDKCVEDFPCVLRSFRVSGNLPQVPRFEAFPVEPCIRLSGQLRRTAL